MTFSLFDVAFVASLTGGAAYDADALAYITAVEAADAAAGQSGGLETGVKDAINDFVVGCKADGIWIAIKACCILAGARTLNGCLVPLVGTAPTSFNFVAGDYDRETGLKGNGSTKYLDSNRANNLEPQNSKHVVIYKTNENSNIRVYFASGGPLGVNGRSYCDYRLGINTDTLVNALQKTIGAGMIALNRANASEFTYRSEQSSVVYAQSSSPPDANTIVFNARRNSDGSINFNGDARLAFYSIGESLDLALLDARVTALIAAIGAAIP